MGDFWNQLKANSPFVREEYSIIKLFYTLNKILLCGFSYIFFVIFLNVLQLHHFYEPEEECISSETFVSLLFNLIKALIIDNLMYNRWRTHLHNWNWSTKSKPGNYCNCIMLHIRLFLQTFFLFIIEVHWETQSREI